MNNEHSSMLEYNGQVYRLNSGDVPDLVGTGNIVVKNRNGLQYQEWLGTFDNICMRQVGDKSFVNGVDVDELVERLEKTD